jgi:methionyl-tRNA formyltransferase
MNGEADTVFLGTSEFAVPILETLAAGSYRPSLAITRIDAKAGRGMQQTETPVATAASRLGIPVLKVRRVREIEALPVGALFAVSASFGLWLTGAFLSRLPMGVVNVHPSLLPRHRGPCPVERAILEGDAETGVAFMLTDDGWDTGPLLRTIRTGILPGENAGDLSSRLSLLACRELAGVLGGYLAGALVPEEQSGTATQADKFTEPETWLDWNQPAEAVERRVRALAPVPGARTLFRGRMLKVLSASVSTEVLMPGVLDASGRQLLAGCPGGSLALEVVQPESRKSMSGAAFAAGYRPAPGDRLG